MLGKFFGSAANTDGQLTPKASVSNFNPFDHLTSSSRKSSVSSLVQGTAATGLVGAASSREASTSAARSVQGATSNYNSPAAGPGLASPSFFSAGYSSGGAGDVTPGAVPLTPGAVATTGEFKSHLV